MLDTFAIIELFKGTDKGAKVKALLLKEETILVSSLSLYETSTVLEREIGVEKAQEYVHSIRNFYQVTNIDAETAMKAAELKREFKLPTVDCLIYASARLNKATVVSGCKHFKELSKQKDVIVV